MTKQSQGVYFEAGYALALKRPVIWTCNEKENGELHFDTRQYSHILWKDYDDLKNELSQLVEAVVGKGSWSPDKE